MKHNYRLLSEGFNTFLKEWEDSPEPPSGIEYDSQEISEYIKDYKNKENDKEFKNNNDGIRVLILFVDENADYDLDEIVRKSENEFKYWDIYQFGTESVTPQIQRKIYSAKSEHDDDEYEYYDAEDSNVKYLQFATKYPMNKLIEYKNDLIAYIKTLSINDKHKEESINTINQYIK